MKSDDLVFKALADENRRKILDRLRATASAGQNGRTRQGLTLNEICGQHDMSRQAVSKHLRILERANLVVTRKQGRFKLHFLNPVPINEIYTRWIGKYEQGRLAALDNLKQALEGDNK